MTALQTGALVVYKNKPARIRELGDKIEIDLPGGKTQRVRDKDVQWLHAGPVARLDGLGEGLSGEPDEARALMEQEALPIADVAELVFSTATPETVWATWLLLQDGLHFHGSAQALHAQSDAHVEKQRAARAAEQAAAKAEAAQLERFRKGEMIPEDASALSDVELLAYGKSSNSRILKALGIEQTPQLAHNLLLRLGHWNTQHNPYPARYAAPTDSCEGEVPALREEARRDLTALSAFAIDDVGNTDPDDAISLEGDRIWVHIADVAALVDPDSPLDLAARERGSSLYLPEGTRSMLPHALVEQLGMGLASESPALSIGFRLNQDGEVEDIDITPSRVRVQRITYAEAEQQLDQAPLSALWILAQRYQEIRRARGAIRLQLPEVKLRVEDGHVQIRPLPWLRSRDLVTEFMLMAGEAAARYAQQHGLAFPYSTQPPPEPLENPADDRAPETLPEMVAFRKRFQRSQLKSTPDTHHGLGMAAYSQVTSPMRRYLDLVAHQQLRAHLRDADPLDDQALIERVGAAEALIGNLRRSERESNRHWTLVWFLQNPEWQGEAIIANIERGRAHVVIPALAYEARVRAPEGAEIGQAIQLAVREVDLATQDVLFRVVN